MLINKRMLLLGGSVFLLFLSIFFSLCMFDMEVSLWFSNLFLDKLFIFVLVPLYLFGCLFIEKHMMISAIVRYEDRTKAELCRLKRLYGFTVVFVCIWFSLLMFFTTIKYGGMHGSVIREIYTCFFQYLVGFLLLCNFILILKRVGNYAISSNAHLFVYCYMILEVMVLVPEIEMHTSFSPKFLFSWIFASEAYSSVILIAGVLFSLLYYFKVSMRKDMIC